MHGTTVIQAETITGTNKAPVVTTALTNTAHEGDAVFTRDLLSNATDPDTGETATLTVTKVSYSVDGRTSSTSVPAGLSLGTDGHTLTIDPTDPSFVPLAAGQTRTIVVSYDVTDVHGATVVQTETITITGTSDAVIQHLTAGNDTIVTPPFGATVYATAATLNAGDSLTGGAGIDVLELVGSGMFRLDQLASFTGFEKIVLDNATNSSVSLTLGSQPIEVHATGYLNIQVNSPSNWNGSNIIDGDASHSWSTTNLNFSNWDYPQSPATYDLTSNTFSHISSVYGNGDDLTLLVNNADTTSIQSFNAWGQNDRLVTASSTLDLSHTTVAGFMVASTNGLGTTFTVGDLGTAFQIAGGSGNDTIVAQGFNFSADQRTAIFSTSCVEVIQDSTGLYSSHHDATLTANAIGENLVGGSGNDTLITAFSDSTLTGNGGSDHFVFKENFGVSTVMDFNVAHDAIDLSAVVATNDVKGWIAAHVEQSGSDTLVHMDAADTIVLHNVSAISLSASDFIVR